MYEVLRLNVEKGEEQLIEKGQAGLDSGFESLVSVFEYLCRRVPLGFGEVDCDTESISHRPACAAQQLGGCRI